MFDRIQELWRVEFHVHPLLVGMPRPKWLCCQEARNPHYRNEGRNRPEAKHFLFKYTLRGEGRFSDKAGEYALPPGTGFLCRLCDPDMAYFFPPKSKEPWRFVFLAFEAPLEMVTSLLHAFGPVFHFTESHPVLRHFIQYQDHTGKILELNPSQAWRLVSELLSSLLIIGEKRSEFSAASDLLSRARKFALTHPKENLSVADLAEAMEVSREHLCRVFRGEMGTTPLKFLHRQRMMRACNLLANTQLSIKQIAYRLGYDNSSHFARGFQKATGFRPVEFRQQGVLIPPWL
jgi:AraC family transcriptional regulator of arabinose operon